MKAPKGKKAKKVIFSFSEPEAGTVFLGGDFNDWDQTKHPMKKDKKGVWKVSQSRSWDLSVQVLCGRRVADRSSLFRFCGESLRGGELCQEGRMRA
jgi:hypothetical protein